MFPALDPISHNCPTRRRSHEKTSDNPRGDAASERHSRHLVVNEGFGSEVDGRMKMVFPSLPRHRNGVGIWKRNSRCYRSRNITLRKKHGLLLSRSCTVIPIKE